MRRDPRGYLSDVLSATQAIAEFTQSRSFDEYQLDLLLRSAVERQFEIIGEALNQLSRLEPDLARRIPELPQVVAFRNILIHGYAVVDDATVWRAIHHDLPRLRERATRLLDELGSEP